MERRSAAALERLGEIPPPRTPIPDAFKEVEGIREGIEWYEQSSASATELQECVERMAQRLGELEQRLVQVRGKELRQGACDDAQLQGLMEEAGRVRSEVSRLRRTNEEVRVDDDGDGRVGPIPRHVCQGPPDPVWIAIPLKGEDIEDVQDAQPSHAKVLAHSAASTPLSTPPTAMLTSVGAVRQQKGAPDVVTPLDRMQGGEESRGAPQQPPPHPHVASHVRRELPEDYAVGIPMQERGAHSVPLRGFTRRPAKRS